MSDFISNIRRFVGQSSDVTALCLSHAPLRLVASGGQDARVNLWSLERANCLMTLTGYSKEITSVNFHSNNEKLVAGDESGVFKVWDLNQAKLTHTFSSHKERTTCLQFHSFGEFLASASVDRSVKLWDLRRKGCIMTFKGHSTGVNSVCFSPDGRWLASGDEAGVVQLWDLATHTKICSFEEHKTKITSINFHPTELIMSTGCAEGLTMVWDLDAMKQLMSLGGREKEGVRSVLFNKKGSHLLSLTTNRLNICAWDPAEIQCFVDTQHPHVHTAVLHDNVLICAEHNQNVVNTFSIDTEKMSNDQKIKSSLNSTRKKFREHSPTSDGALKAAFRREGDEGDKEGGEVEVKVDEYKQFFEKDVKVNDDDKDDYFTNKKELQVIHDLSQGHRKVIDNMRSRGKCLRVVKREWIGKSLKNAIITVVSLREQSAIVDILHVLLGNVNLWSLDICQALLPVLEELVSSEQEEHIHISLSTLRLIGHTFGHVIKSNVNAPPPPHDVDISRQDRYYKCKTCHKVLGRIHGELGGHLERVDEMSRLGCKIKEMYVLLESVLL